MRVPETLPGYLHRTNTVVCEVANNLYRLVDALVHHANADSTRQLLQALLSHFRFKPDGRWADDRLHDVLFFDTVRAEMGRTPTNLPGEAGSGHALVVRLAVRILFDCWKLVDLFATVSHDLLFDEFPVEDVVLCCAAVGQHFRARNPLPSREVLLHLLRENLALSENLFNRWADAKKQPPVAAVAREALQPPVREAPVRLGPLDLATNRRPAWVIGDGGNWQEVAPITELEADAVDALVRSHPARLTEDELDSASGHPASRKALRALARRDPRWAAVLDLRGGPGRPRKGLKGYGLSRPAAARV